MKRKFKISLIMLISLLNIINNISLANANDNIGELEYSTQYTNWLELSDKDKEKTVMPSMFTVNLEESINNDTVAEKSSDEIELPSYYNTAEKIRIPVRDQGSTDSCWAVVSTELFEIFNAKKNNLNSVINFSERHVEYSCSNVFKNDVINEDGYNRKAGDGGQYQFAMAYYTRGNGPILYTDMPFENNKNIIDISEIQNKTVQAQLEQFTEYPNIYKNYDETNNVEYFNGEKYDRKVIYTDKQINDFRNMIKQQIKENGAVASYTYYKSSESYFTEEEGYQLGSSYFCNNAGAALNHAICIVGWDDNYSKTNFKEGCQPANDGAYIVLNSWGTEWNSGKGYYYISYDDVLIEQKMYGIQAISEIDFDKIYQYDKLGYNASFYSNYIPNEIYGANVFYRDSSAREKLSEIGIYLVNNTDVTIYLNNNKDFNISDEKIILKANDLMAGYHCLKLEEPILVGKTFTIIVKYENEVQAKIALEAKPNNTTSKYSVATSNKQESYYSFNGDDFYDFFDYTEYFSNANVCIKAFITNETEKANNNEYIVNDSWRIIKHSEGDILYGVEENTTIEELLSSTNFSNDYIIKAYKNDIEISTGKVITGTVIKIYKEADFLKEYSIIIYGDTNLDGNITSADALAIVKNNLGIVKFKSKIYEEAGRVTSNTRTLQLIPSAVDALAIVKHKLEFNKILQL